ncbi:MAG: SRPBCC domain-containing protein [Myxococcales bacterium]|nr:SRPBCC domain-containing protein [Myxococcales bacterium]
MPKDPFLRITRILPAPPDVVFQAWTDAEGMRTWFCPADTMTHAEASLDVRPGGKWRIAMHGEGVYVQEGEYLEVDPPRKLVMTWRSEMLENKDTTVTVELAPHGSGETELTKTHEAFNNAANRDGYEGGWGAIAEKLGRHL